MPKTAKSNTATIVQNAPSPNAKPASPQTAPTNKAVSTSAAPVGGAKQDQTKPLQPVAERFPASEDQEVTFKFNAPTAKEVKVAGSFNGWNPESAPLKKSGSGEWKAQLKLRSGKYEYRFVVDGKWCEDPQATQRGVNPFGGFNSILNVPLGARP